MVCTNALLVAMGYRLGFFNNIPAGMTRATMIRNRKGQIALELHRGRLAIAPTPQFVPPTWPRQSDEYRYTSGSTPFKKLTSRNCDQGVVEELSRRDRARWYRGVPPKIDFDGRPTKAALIAYGTAQGYARIPPMSWGALRNWFERADYMTRTDANGAPATNPPSY
ncbi:9e572356-26a4-4c0d-bc1a-b7c10c03d41a-CDS [Sclerotinia trifoliorum]|uniref:9e572356-26a4-4c0d-bc1a-b7c10c03d41a-CDS n=1 Tax=Sclerotinia trifoliorum TaxID=28548 RepID=A0A8H2VW12_9HELO|nr:9e572356-26a4-4c0d-bc1a-b7c10c03d41a-CDS [Sclerotinia trifoliorum]